VLTIFHYSAPGTRVPPLSGNPGPRQ